MRAAIVGIAGPTLSADEIALFAEAPPAGIILFARNVETPDQLATLIAAMPGTAVLIDQEGGRVARLRPPHWRAHPPAAAHATPRAAWLTGALIGLDCAALGIDIVCAPVLDRPVPGAHDVIGDRAFATTDHARAMADGLLAAGIQPVGKHAPGHGRAGVDSHAGLPAVHGPIDDDLAPFHALRSLPWMMTAHILYTALDADRPGTLSPIVVRLIREQIGFGGVLVTGRFGHGGPEWSARRTHHGGARGRLRPGTPLHRRAGRHGRGAARRRARGGRDASPPRRGPRHGRRAPHPARCHGAGRRA